MESPISDQTITEHLSLRRARRGQSAPHLFLLLECERPLMGSACYELHPSEVVELGRGSERRLELQQDEQTPRLTVRIPDRWMSSAHARLTHGPQGWIIEDVGSRNGTLVNGLRHERVLLNDGDLIELGHTLFLFRSAMPAVVGQPLGPIAGPAAPHTLGLTTFSAPLAREFQILAHIAPSELPVLIQGESGTGKELIARAVHTLSRRSGSFVAVNCGALPEQLVASELFGHVRGAFTGATHDRPGLIRSSHQGTLFLDEIGDLPLVSQTILLRVLQEREVVPVGGHRPVPVDLRVVSATHRDIARMANEGVFRQDLLARLSGHVMTLPPLRERREDLGIFIVALLQRLAGERAGSISFNPSAARILVRHDWPLNVRELEHCLGRAIVLSGFARIEPEHLQLGPTAPSVPETPALRRRPLSPREQTWREQLLELLREHHGNVTDVAEALHKKRAYIYRLMKRFGISPDSFRVEPV
ncbi:MAG TPA: sigma 54-interacting transcriptional regulator [Polyangia bacterium]|jgi:transcriptional regulator with AAA-type ATPase domain|nr:sigma 54-interacting transcriptional regulator [Polyangia bacterium]